MILDESSDFCDFEFRIGECFFKTGLLFLDGDDDGKVVLLWFYGMLDIEGDDCVFILGMGGKCE